MFETIPKQANITNIRYRFPKKVTDERSIK
ncbi:hypothetical protein Desgi_4678 [Desulfoscipio gibsoniae DSM 7213]|uniref:Uncharacterized protein n=1 Tax=Desulfoscipio gibsoniae DSM 7213 TaxID=767817 RepID=R4KMJ4_9FIRM|nr:hypothetical protein Desgi_4678 [Desulfoscipio gibsoniae DSM 7213]